MNDDRSQFFRGRKVAIVTGSKRGIGKAIAVGFAEAGADVVVSSRVPKDDEFDLETVAEEIRRLGRRSLAVQADVTKKADVDNLVKRAVDEFGTIDILVNNAAVRFRKPLFEYSEEEWHSVIDTDLKGYFLCSQAAGKVMVARKSGSIVNISSVQGFVCQKNVAAYAASKGGAIALTRAMALDHASDNIRVNCICPGSIDTPMLQYGAGKHGKAEEVIKEWGDNHPIGRVGKPEEVAKTVMFLWSEDSGFITAQPIIVDGGLISGIF